MPTTKRAAAYIRVSTLDQRTRLQGDEVTSLIERRGWTLHGVYEDQGHSGASERRPGLDRLLADARKKRFDALVVWRSDRLFRSVHHMVVTLTDLAALGIDFVSATEAFDTSTPTGKLLFHICTAFGQFERDVIAERTIAGMAAARRRGVHVGRPRVEIDLARARQLRHGGLTIRAVAQELGVGYGSLQRALQEVEGGPEGCSPEACLAPVISEAS